MSDENEDDPLAGILGDELGEWDKMFDSLHEEALEEEAAAPAKAAAPAPSVLELPTPPAGLSQSEAQAPVPADGDVFDFELAEDPLAVTEDPLANPAMATPTMDPPASEFASSPFDDEVGFALGPPGAVPSEGLAGADDELDFGSVPEALGTLLGSEGHEDLDLELGSYAASSVLGSRVPVLSDVVLDDVLSSSAPATAEQELARISESANAFFEDDGPAPETTLELDEDFYEGIEVGSGAIPTPIPEDEPMQSAPTTVEMPDSIGSSSATPVRGVVVPDEARRDDGPAAVAAVEDVGAALQPEESDGVPVAFAETGHGALRTGAIRAESEDSLELASEVEGALESIRSGPSTPAPADFELPSMPEMEGPDDAGPVAVAPASEAAGAELRLAPQLDGVVEAAVEEAVAMSTGTLHTGPQLKEVDVEPDLPAATFSGVLPELDLARLHVPERVEADVSDRTDAAARMLVLYERELGLLDEPGAIIRMRIEAGRLAESLGDLDRARRHLDEALKLDPRLVPANRSLRRIERKLGNWDQVVSQLDNEIQKAGPMEARALSAYRADLLMAVGESDLARVAVGELLDSAPKDTRALLANLELAFVDGREDEIQSTLAALADSLSGPRLRSSVLALAGTLAANEGNQEASSARYAAADASAPNLGAQLALAAKFSTGLPGEEFAALVSSVGQKASELAAVLAWHRAEAHLSAGEQQDAERVVSQALDAVPGNALLVETALRASVAPETIANAWQGMAAVASTADWSAQAHARAAQLAARQPDGVAVGIEMAARALAAKPADPFTRALIRRLGGSAATAPPQGETATEHEAFLHAWAQHEAGDDAAASAIVKPLLSGDTNRTPSLSTFALELGFHSGDWSTLHQMYSAIASGAGHNDVALQAQRAAARALSRLAASADGGSELRIQAAEAWRAQATMEPGVAAETALLMACQSGDEASIAECSAVAIEQAASEGRRAQLALFAAGQNLVADPGEAADGIGAIVGEGGGQRVSELYWASSLASERMVEAAECFEAEANREGLSEEAAARYRFRSAYLRVHYDLDLDVAVQSLLAVQASRPAFGASSDLLAVARGHGGVGSASARSESAAGAGTPESVKPSLPQDSIGVEVRLIEAMARSGRIREAAERSSALRALHPHDALVQHTFERQCWKAGASDELVEVASAQLREAEDASDMAAKAEACATLARIEAELRGNRDAARAHWEAASKAVPSSADLQRILEREYRGNTERREEQRSVLGRVIGSLEAGSERSAYLVCRARLSRVLERDAEAVRSDYEGALQDDAQCREALFYLEAEASVAGPTETLANLEAKVSQYFADDPRARGAFLVRSGETWRSLGQREQCLARLKSALQVVPGFAPALSAWRDLALDHELWAELAEACLLEAESADNDAARSSLYLLAGVTLMDKVEDADGAIAALQNVLRVEPLQREAFVRLRKLFTEKQGDEDLAQLLSMRIEAGPTETQERCELHLALARVLGANLENADESLVHYRALLALRPNDKEAVTAISGICWGKEQWADAAEALMILARLEADPKALASVFQRLGTIYADHLPEPRWALKSFHRVVTLDPGNPAALRNIALLGAECGEPRLALGACEQLIKQEPPVAERIEILILMSKILLESASDLKNAERALRHALDLDPGNDAALDALIEFYLGQNDVRSARIHADRVANAMRKRIEESTVDGEAYRVLARSMAAKARAGASECVATAQVAASVAQQLGIESEETAALARKGSPGIAAGLAGDTFDDLLFPPSAPASARTIFALLGARLAKHIGIDVRSHGVGRSDRLRKGIDSSASLILEVATEMGVEDVDIYVSKQKPHLLAVEPTNPVSLIVGEDLANAERPAELRFFVGRSLKGAAASLSAPVQLGEERFGVLLVGILRQFQPEFVPSGVDPEAASVEQQRLRRLIPSSLLQELQPYALGLATGEFSHKAIWQGLLDACNRAGLLCAGDGSAAITGLLRSKGLKTLREGLQDPEIASLVRFACSSEHDRLWAAMRG